MLRTTSIRKIAVGWGFAAVLALGCGSEDAAPEVAETPTDTVVTTTTAAPTATGAPEEVAACDDPAAEDLGDGFFERDGFVYEMTDSGCLFRPRRPEPEPSSKPEPAAEPAAVEDTPPDAPSEGPAPEECEEGQHRHTPEGFCHGDAETLPAPPSACENDWRSGECTTADGAGYTLEDGVWVHQDAQPETGADRGAGTDEPEAGPEESEPLTGSEAAETDRADCADLAGHEVPASEFVSVDLSQPGTYEWELCFDGAGGKPWMSGQSHYPGMDQVVFFVGFGDAECDGYGIEQLAENRFMLRFGVTDDPYDFDREVAPCWNPVVDGARGAWATEYSVQIVAPDRGADTWFRVQKVNVPDS